MGARSKGNIWVNRSCWVTSQPGRPLMDACGKGWSHTCVDKLWLRLALCEACEACSSFYPSWAALKQWGLTAVLNRHLMHIPHVLISGFMASSSPQGLFFFSPLCLFESQHHPSVLSIKTEQWDSGLSPATCFSGSWYLTPCPNSSLQFHMDLS